MAGQSWLPPSRGGATSGPLGRAAAGDSTTGVSISAFYLATANAEGLGAALSPPADISVRRTASKPACSGS
jgi:hypothetical protein